MSRPALCRACGQRRQTARSACGSPDKRCWSARQPQAGSCLPRWRRARVQAIRWMAMELQSFRDLPASLQRRRPVPDDRWGLRRGRAVLHPGERRHGYWLRIPAGSCQWNRYGTARRIAANTDASSMLSRPQCRPSSIFAAAAPPRLSPAASFKCWPTSEPRSSPART